MFDGEAFGAGIAAMVRGYVDDAVAGFEAKVSTLTARIAELEGREAVAGPEGPAGPQGEPGRDGIDGKDGRDGVDGKDGAPGLQGERGLDGQDGAAGRDGLPGQPGATGRDGKDGHDGIDGKDGAPGARGVDGFGLKDFSADLSEDGRTLVLRFIDKGAPLGVGYQLTLPTTIYRGVFKDGQAYQPGDEVTWAGSAWHCLAATSDKPGEGSPAWVLKVKKGRDGRDGKDGKAGDPGPQGAKGDPGRDGRNWS